VVNLILIFLILDHNISYLNLRLLLLLMEVREVMSR